MSTYLKEDATHQNWRSTVRGETIIFFMADIEAQLKALELKVKSIELDMVKKESEMKDRIAKLEESFVAEQKVQMPSVVTEKKRSCTISFAGYTNAKNSKVPSGAAAFLFADDGSEFYEFRKSLNNKTEEGAHYGGLILGLQKALEKGYAHVNVQGSSEYVVNQFGKPWQTDDDHLRRLCYEAFSLGQKFETFSIHLIPWASNGGAILAAEEAVECLLENQDEEKEFKY